MSHFSWGTFGRDSRSFPHVGHLYLATLPIEMTWFFGSSWASRQKDVKIITGMTANSVLYAKVAKMVEHAAYLYDKEGEDVKLYTRFWYKAYSWDTGHFVIAKVEHTCMGSNVRFIVTNITDATAKELYETGYCKRGVCELYIKELKTYLKADRMSCSSFQANQFRLFLHFAAYVLLLQAKQLLFSGTDLTGVSIMTFRERVILSAVRILAGTKQHRECPFGHFQDACAPVSCQKAKYAH